MQLTSGNWPGSIIEARQVQEALQRKAITCNDFSAIEYVAGTDVSYFAGDTRAQAAWVVLRLSDLQILDWSIARVSVDFPYISGFLSFRELPPLLEAFYKLKIQPDLVVCDGQGIAHPRNFGLACHLGVTLDIPAFGAAKSKLIGDFDYFRLDRGNWDYLIKNKNIIGAALCTKNGVKPLFVSPGHRVGLGSCIEITLDLTGKYKLPETTRQAHALSRQCLDKSC